MKRWVAFALVLGVASAAFADGRHPWRRRRRAGLRPNRMAVATVNPSDWAPEPASPPTVDPAQFARALHRLCGWMPPRRPGRYAEWIIRYAAEFEEDPFLIGALIHRQTLGSCRPDAEGDFGGLGLTAILRRMYSGNYRRGVYRYRVRSNDAWVERSLRFRFPFAEPRLRRAEENIYFAAALLSTWRDQHATVDEAFEQTPHRHHVSHFVWGDRVRSDRSEDRIFTDRRRLLEYYGSIEPPSPVVALGVTFGSPLDGAPRVISSGMGSRRDGGARSHRGVDFESVPGEEVRSAATGRVIFAGVDMPGRRQHHQLLPDQYDTVQRSELGRGGRFVCVRHRREGQDSLRTCYMHLETVVVAAGQEIERGTLIGTVGRTGMRSSAAHLHFEIHGPDGVLDPRQIMDGLILGVPDPNI